MQTHIKTYTMASPMCHQRQVFQRNLEEQPWTDHTCHHPMTRASVSMHVCMDMHMYVSVNVTLQVSLSTRVGMSVCVCVRLRAKLQGSARRGA